MTDSDELDSRVERLRARHAARKKHNQPSAQAAPLEPSTVQTQPFASSVPATKAERAWIDEHLGLMRERELIDDVLRRIQAGKEATVYACSGGRASGLPVLAAKLYRARSMRGERNAGHYQQGRGVLDADGKSIGPRAWRLQKAIAQKSRAGRQAAQSSWLMHEHGVLTALAERGADVPRPIEHSEHVLLMELIGEGTEAAPTLSQIALTRAEAQPVFERVLQNVELLLELGWVHGDLSAHNLLYQRGRAVLIDFPQVVAAHDNPDARRFFARDIERISHYFGRAGVRSNPERLASQLWSKHIVAGAAR